MHEKTIPIRFHFYSLKFTPYKRIDKKESSNSILVKVITYLTNEMHSGRGHLIDRHQGRDLDVPREIFMTSAVFMPKERRIRCSIALLRAGRMPMLKPADKFKLIPLETLGDIAEQTHFFIDYSNSFGIICIEYVLAPIMLAKFKEVNNSCPLPH